MPVHIDHLTVEQADEILATHVEDTVASGVVLVHLHAASAEQLRDVIFAEESL